LFQAVGTLAGKKLPNKARTGRWAVGAILFIYRKNGELF